MYSKTSVILSTLDGPLACLACHLDTGSCCAIALGVYPIALAHCSSPLLYSDFNYLLESFKLDHFIRITFVTAMISWTKGKAVDIQICVILFLLGESIQLGLLIIVHFCQERAGLITTVNWKDKPHGPRPFDLN